MSTHIAFIGIDGSGKSTCFQKALRVLCEEGLVAGIADGVWLADKDKGLVGLTEIPWLSTKTFFARLAQKYEHKTLYQVTKFAELLCRVKVQNAVLNTYNPKFILTDGSPLINMIGWSSFYHPRYFEAKQCIKLINYLCHDRKMPLLEMGFYIRHIPGAFLINGLNLGKLSRPDIVFLLHINPEIAVSRILERGKERQIHETQTFLGNLQKAYVMVCDLMSSEFGTQVFRISVDNLPVADTVTTIVKHVESSQERIDVK